MVVGIDSRCDRDGLGVHQYTGDLRTTSRTRRNTKSWVREVQQRGAGEIVLNCMNHDGVRSGYDIEQIASIRGICDVPLIASGGAGHIGDFSDLFASTCADGALAASVFHSGELAIGDLKRQLKADGITVRT